MRDFTFNPPTIRVAAGGRVTWTNGGATQHTTTSDGGLWDSGLLQVGSPGGSYGGGSSQPGTFSREFAQAGTFAYHCALHPTVMRGTVIVSP
ncbi:MAG: plastocyanin/azurin family copper-binding protein [Gemmatimonadota bacterium]